MVSNNLMKGVIHGKTIELEKESGLPDGSQVAVLVQPVLPKGDGLRRAFGGWAGDDEKLDEFLAQVRRDRQNDSRNIPE